MNLPFYPPNATDVCIYVMEEHFLTNKENPSGTNEINSLSSLLAIIWVYIFAFVICEVICNDICHCLLKTQFFIL